MNPNPNLNPNPDPNPNPNPNPKPNPNPNQVGLSTDYTMHVAVALRVDTRTPRSLRGYCTHARRMLASCCVPYVPEAQGSLARGEAGAPVQCQPRACRT